MGRGLTDITKDDIEDVAAYDEIVHRGMKYYKQGKIRSLSISGNTASANVQGSNGELYNTSVTAEDGDFDGDCDCPFDGYGCKHIAAVMWKLFYERGLAGAGDIEKSGKEFMAGQLNQPLSSLPQSEVLTAFDLFNTGPINKDSEKGEEQHFSVTENAKPHKVTIKAVKNSWSTDYAVTCGCGARGRFCKHSLAALLLISVTSENAESFQKFEKDFRKKAELDALAALDNAFMGGEGESAGMPKHFPVFNISMNNDSVSMRIEKSMPIASGNGWRAPVKANAKFVRENYAKFPDKIRRVIDFVISPLNDGDGRYEYDSSFGSGAFGRHKFDTSLGDSTLRALREVFAESPALFSGAGFMNGNATAEVAVSKKNHERRTSALYFFAECDGRRAPLRGKNVICTGKDSMWVFLEQLQQGKPLFNAGRGEICEIRTACPELLKRLISCSELEISDRHLAEFLEKHYSRLSGAARVSLPESIAVREKGGIEPKPRLFLKPHENGFAMELGFLYSDREVPFHDGNDIVFRNRKGFVKIRRHREKENEFLSLLLASNAFESDGMFFPSPGPVEWLADSSKKLLEAGFEIFGQNELVSPALRLSEPKLVLAVSSGIDWFDLKAEVDFEGRKIGFGQIRAALSNGERFIRLSDGTTGVIPKKWLSALSGVAGLIEENKGGVLRAGRHQFEIVEAMAGVAQTVTKDKFYSDFIERIKKFKGVKKAPLPKGLKGELRPYQKAGYDWLHFLKEFSFGGCLADDMGLGKTVQVLALLLSEKEKGNRVPSLVVVPKSLVFNWLDEIKKFAPSLTAYVHHGLGRATEKAAISKARPDLIITTYATLRNDIELFSGKKLHYIVLDESQNIKNPVAQSAKSVRTLKCSHRLALTGTPIENSSLDLWSQFAFLNPGLLGDMDYFKSSFAGKIEREKNEEKTLALRNMVNPFILMRKKENVATELPRKQITNLYCEMEPSQREFYEQWKAKFRSEITAMVEARGLAASRMKVLEGLLRLRQICCHPRLVDESYPGESSKFSVLASEIEEVISEGHKALVFSSFAKMLGIFREHFDRSGVRYSYLDGKTTNRKKVVEEFQGNQEIKVFLISLKAGGIGLNLTAADYVFLVDPWWNPAAEMQAIDRAHRIGQQKNVFVYKAITKDSVEEKILGLQNSKLELSKNVVAIEESIFKKLGKEELSKIFG